MHPCNNLDVIKKQAIALKIAIDEHKYYMSQREHRDVGWDCAEIDFFNTYFLGFSCGWRLAFCAFCPSNKDCTIGSKYSI